MKVLSIIPSTTVLAHDTESLAYAWQQFGAPFPISPVARFVIDFTLTPAERRRLPKALRELLVEEAGEVEVADGTR